MPSRRDFLQFAGLGALSAPLGWAQTRQPNLLVMLAGSLPDFALAPGFRGPNLARFAQESLQFERAYVACPQTGPSQASLLSGRFPLPGDKTTFTQVLKDAGYQTAMLGDWHLGGAQKDGDTGAAVDFMKQTRRSPFSLLVAWQPGDGASIDDYAGQLLTAITDLKLKNNTITVFTSDHGYGSGPLEPTVRIPLMLRFPPRLDPGLRAGVLASTVDLAPTLLALCGVAAPESMQGRDLTREQPQAVYAMGGLGTAGEWRMLVRGLDKLVVDRDQNITHLFNLGVDPDEMDNHARDSAFELKRDELQALMKDWMRRTSDGFDPSGLKRRA
jgi:arylsulfatase A-like enzyme